MKQLNPRSLRVLIGFGAFLGFALALLLILFVTETALSVWQLLKDRPSWFLLFYLSGLAAFSAIGIFIVWRLLRPKQRRALTRESPSVSEDALRDRIATASDQGIGIAEVRQDLDELECRRRSGEIYVALFGAISVGKSSLIRALLPNAEIEIDPRGGTTREVRHYHWTSPLGDALTLTDLPGLFEPGSHYTPLAQEEVLRAHIVIYVCDGDLTRDQHDEVQSLLAFNKPMLLAVNKTDRYTQEELEQITERLRERLQGKGEVSIVPIRAGGSEQVTRVYPNGREEVVTREAPAQVAPLMAALRARIERLGAKLETSRDRGFVTLAGRKLDSAVRAHRQGQAEVLVKQYTRRAIVGALAAIAPGTDLLIQGYLGMQLVKGLCATYDVPTHDVDLRKFIDLASQHVSKTFPMLLAMSGNVCKAFPGLGTVTGALMHAVAYGLIFESLGKSLAMTLDEYGELRPGPTIERFEEKLREDLEVRARAHAKTVYEELKKRRGE